MTIVANLAAKSISQKSSNGMEATMKMQWVISVNRNLRGLQSVAMLPFWLFLDRSWAGSRDRARDSRVLNETSFRSELRKGIKKCGEGKEKERKKIKVEVSDVYGWAQNSR